MTVPGGDLPGYGAAPVNGTSMATRDLVRRLVPGPEGNPMASKDKGGKSSKTAASKTPQEKRAAKREKKKARARDERSL